MSFTRGRVSKRHKLAIIGAGTGLVVLAVGIIGYFSFVRASDTTYSDALRMAERVHNIAGDMIEREDMLRLGDTGASDLIADEARALQAQYKQALQDFEESSAYQHDSAVKKAYDGSSTIKRYGNEYVQTLRTQATIGRLLTICDKVYVATTNSYNAALEPCRAEIQSSMSVASRDYDTRYYQTYRKYLETSLVATTSLSKVIENGDLKALDDASKQYGVIEQQGGEVEPDLPERIMPDPRPDLLALIKTLEERKRQVWR